jgi:hypothetical protein
LAPQLEEELDWLDEEELDVEEEAVLELDEVLDEVLVVVGAGGEGLAGVGVGEGVTGVDGGVFVGVVVVLQGFWSGYAMMMGTVSGRLGAWHLLFTYTNPTSQTHSFPLKKAFTGHEGAAGTATEEAGEMTVGAGVMIDGGGEMTEGGGEIIDGVEVTAKVVVLPELVLEVMAEETELAAFVAVWVLLVAGPIIVVVVEVLTEPFTHLPLARMSPSLLEQVLQATPPSLNVNAYEAGSQDATQLFPLGINPFPQLEQTFPGSTPTTT